MLKPAQLYREQLKHCIWETAYDDKYKFVHPGYINIQNMDEDSWNKHQFVSVTKYGYILGFISYSIDQQTHSVHSLTIMSFDKSLTFGLDLRQAINDIFYKFNFNKMNFSVVVGNPIEKTYDRFIEKHGGRIVGIKKQDAMLLDGKIYDIKLYEILKEEHR